MGGVNSEDAQKKIQALFPKRARDTRNRAGEEREVRRTSRCCEADTRFSGECFALFSWPLWRRVSALVFSILVMMQPSVAMASSAVPWATVDGPFVTGNTTTSDGYVVLNVTNEYMAALAIIGRSGEYLQLTSEQLAKLSNASTGGKFYELAHSFQAVGYDGNSSYYPSWWGDGIAGMQAYAMQMVQACGGYGHVWAVETNQAKIASALEDYEVIYSGGSLGGGTSSGGVTDDGSYYYFKYNVTLVSDVDVYGVDGFCIPADKYAGYQTWLSALGDGYKPFMAIGTGAVGGVNVFITWLQSMPDIFLDSSMGGSDPYPSISNGGRNASSWHVQGSYRPDRSPNLFVEHDGGYYLVFTHDWSTTNTRTEGSSVLWGIRPVIKYYWGGEVSNQPVIPPTNWPDTPTNPQTEPEPPVYDTPTPTPPQLPTVNIETDVNFTADFAGLIDALDEHCQHLQQAIYDGFADYYDAITEYMGDLYDGIMTWNGSVVDWLQEWFERWDSMFIYEFAMLRNYEKQQVGMLRTLVSTVADISAKLDNMGRVITAEDIPSSYNADVVATSGSGTLKSAYNALRTKFPFSVLDGIATFAGNLETTPVAPVFDIPVPNPFGNHTPYSIHFDFSAYSDWAAILRTGELILAYLGLSRSAGRLWLGSGDAA